MIKSKYILAFLMLSQLTIAQIHEIGVFAGGSNFIGDVGPTTYILPKQPAFGVLYKWNVNPRYSWRFSAMHSKIKARDAKSDINSRKQRNLNFQNSLTEFSAGMEFNWFEFNQHHFGFKSTPYLYSGISYFISDDLYLENANKFISTGTSGSIAIPIIAGYKMQVSDSFVIGAEVGARYTFSDDIDGSFPTDEKFRSQRFGNLNSKDWYVFSGLTITYTFGNKPCYCND